MEKKEYNAPDIKIYGDIKEITLGGGANEASPDGTYMTDSAGNLWKGFNPIS